MKRVFTLTIECNHTVSGESVQTLLEAKLRAADPHGTISALCHVDTIKLSERQQAPKNK